MDGFREACRKKLPWSIPESLKQRVLKTYREVTLPDLLWGLVIVIFFAYFFYRSIWAFIPMLPVGAFMIYDRVKKKNTKRQREYLEQFKECILSVVSAVKAGYAVENAFAESVLDLEVLYGEGCGMAEEIRMVCREVRNNTPLEVALMDLGKRSGLQEVAEFAEVFSIAKRNSGNITQTIEMYSRMITDKLELLAELETLLAAKRLEQRVMNVMPFLIVGYLGLTNPGYFDMMYHNLTGVIIMTVCLVVYLGAYILSEKIFEKTYG